MKLPGLPFSFVVLMVPLLATATAGGAAQAASPGSCGRISVFDVADGVSINNTDTSHDDDSPAITLRMSSIAPTAGGGKVTSASGATQATFPGAGGYVLNARSPVKGVVQEGGLPPGCAKQESGPNAKVITCGTGRGYELVAGVTPDYVGPPKDSNVILSYQ